MLLAFRGEVRGGDYHGDICVLYTNVRMNRIMANRNNTKSINKVNDNIDSSYRKKFET